MGSIDKACISGFLCRLCSEMHRIVIHIYGDQGQRLCLVEKINGYLPITISPTDPLPKTICTTCLRRVEQHYDLLMRLSKIKERKFLRVDKEHRRRVQEHADLISSLENSDDEVYHSDDESRRRRQQLQDQTQVTQSPQSQQEQTLTLTPTSSVPTAATSSSLSAVIAASFSTASITTDSSSMNVASPESDDEDNDVADDSAASTSAGALTSLTHNFIAISDSASSAPFNNRSLSVEVDQQSFVDNVVGGGGNSFGIVSQQNHD